MGLGVSYSQITTPWLQTQVGERQKRRKVLQVKTYMSSTLEPCLSSYGLTATSVTTTSADGCPITIPITDSLAPHASMENQTHSAEVTTARTLYLLDRFAVSDQFYHELAQV